MYVSPVNERTIKVRSHRMRYGVVAVSRITLRHISAATCRSMPHHDVCVFKQDDARRRAATHVTATHPV